MSNPALTNVAKSAIFTPAGGSAWNLTDLLEMDDGEEGSGTETTTDNAQTVNGAYVDSVKGEVSVKCTDFQHTVNAGCVIGATGSLVIAYSQRAQGKGAVSAKTLTVTYANAQLRSIRRGAGVTGTGTITVTWLTYDPAGTVVHTAAVA